MSSNKSNNPKKDSILELAKMMDATVRVKCSGGRELQGILRGYDELVNLVLDDCDEFLRGTFLACSVLLYDLCIIDSLHFPLISSSECMCRLTNIDPEDSERVTDKTRRLGLVVVRGTQVSLVSPQEGVEEIANPFLVGDEDE